MMPKSNKERQREVRRNKTLEKKVTCSVTELKGAWFSWVAGCVSAFSTDVSAGLFSQTSFSGGGFFTCRLFHLLPADGQDTYVRVVWMVRAKALRCGWVLRGGGAPVGSIRMGGPQGLRMHFGRAVPKWRGPDPPQPGTASAQVRGQQWAALRFGVGDGHPSAGESGQARLLLGLC